jgi:hypothetical protein
MSTDNKPDYNSYTYNYREGRFANVSYPFNPEQGSIWSAFPTDVGVLSETNDQVVLTADNKLVIQLFDKHHDTGFHVDSVGALYGRILNSLRQDQYRKDAIVCNTVGLIAQDNRAVKVTDNYSDSLSEQATPPNKDLLMPSLYEWINIWKRARGELEY